MNKIICASLTSLAILSPVPVAAKTPPVQYFVHPGGKPFSRAVRVGDFVYISGAVGAAADGTFPADFSVQAKNTMDNVAAQLKLAGATMDDVYNCRVAMTDMGNWEAFNEVYRTYFKPDRLPVRMAIGVSSLRGAAVEVQCDAVLAKR